MSNANPVAGPIYFERQMRIAAKAITPCPHGHLFAPQNPPMMNVSFQSSTVCVCVCGCSRAKGVLVSRLPYERTLGPGG